MKTAKVTLADATYYLAFDGEAMFTLRDDFGGTQLALEAIEQDTRESFAATCAIAAVLAERGELLRRRLGYDPGAIPEKDDFLLMVRPFEIVTLKRAIMTAIELGYGREVTSPADDEIDEGLAELNQKKTRYYNSMLDVLDLAYMTVNHEKIPPNVLKEWVKLITDELSQISKIKRSDKARA